MNSEKLSTSRMVAKDVRQNSGLIQLDGSYGEGGGQILRSALTLSLLTGRAVEIVNIRAGRPNPGLQAQHLKAVEAAAAISGSRVEGAMRGSRRLTFFPQPVRPGKYRFDIGTAGSTSLVLQTVVYPLALAGDVSTVTLTGGTHVPWAPSWHYLQMQWATMLRRIGFSVELELPRAGFYPRGGGEVRARIDPAASLQPLELTDRGALQSITGISGVGQLRRAIAVRQARRAEQLLQPLGVPVQIETAELPAACPGSFLLLLAHFERTQLCSSVLGAPGKPAENVADEAATALLAMLAGTATVDDYLADQLLLPLALAGRTSSFRTPRITRHLLTNAWVIEQFLPCRIAVTKTADDAGEVRIEATAAGVIPLAGPTD